MSDKLLERWDDYDGKTYSIFQDENRPKVIDLFAGVGGFSLGFEQAGFDIIAAVEIDPIHTSCHHYNFPNTKIFTSSVKDLTGEIILNECSLRVGDIDVVVGAPHVRGFLLLASAQWMMYEIHLLKIL